MSLAIKFGVALKKARQQRGLSQLKLAELSDLHLNAVQLIESGKRKPRLDTLFSLAKGLGIEPSELIALLEKGLSKH